MCVHQPEEEYHENSDDQLKLRPLANALTLQNVGVTRLVALMK